MSNNCETSEKAELQNSQNSCNGEPRPITLSLLPYWILVIVRVVLTLVPQSGYIHPDEYFQTLEVLNGDIFSVASVRPWEFNSTFPIRSVALPYAVMGLPLFILKSVAPFMYLWFDIKVVNVYTLLIVPRLACCLLSFISDLCLYRICYIYGQNCKTRLLTLASSYVMLVYGTRSFTNSLEMALASYLLYLVAKCMARSDQIIYQDEYLQDEYNKSDNLKDRVKFHRLRLSLPWHSLSDVFYIATLTVVGVFNRPTFFAFAFPPLFFWLLRGLGTRSITMADFNLRIIALIFSALPALILLITVDSFYYGYLTLDELINRKFVIWRDIALTPYNFILYNLDSNNLKEHGLHPRFTHFLVNIPLLFNVLGFSGLIAFFDICSRGVRRRWSRLPRVQSMMGLMVSSWVGPVGLLSAVPHQEPRFLIPATLPLVFLHSARIREPQDHPHPRRFIPPQGRDVLLALWYAINIFFTIFYGFVHQAGIYPLLNHLSTEIEAKPRLTVLHLVTSHVYPLPLSLLQLRVAPTATFTTPNGTSRYQRSRDVLLYELGSADMGQVMEKLMRLKEAGEAGWREKRLKWRLYYVGPSSLRGRLQEANLSVNLSLSLRDSFYPHLSTEALPTITPSTLSHLLTQIRLDLYTVDN